MNKFFKVALFILILCVAFAGCSKTNITNNPVPEVQNKTVEKFYNFEISQVTMSEVIPIQKGTRVEILWAYSYVRYNGQSYVISSDKVVKKRKVGKKIGVVNRFLSSTMVISGEKFIEKDGDSNYLAKGSLIYEFKGRDVSEAIIVDDNGVFKEAIPYSN